MSGRKPSTGNPWSILIKQEIMAIKGRLDAIESQMKTLQTSGSGSSGSTDSSSENDGSIVEETDGNSMPIKGNDFKETTENAKSASAATMEATYALNQASISMRGYSTLLSEMGLSKDQKRMLAQLNETMMMIQKVASTLKLLEAAQAAFEAGSGPIGWLELAFAGGTAASGIAYGSKVTSGNV
jgi:hypothetical protein